MMTLLTNLFYLLMFFMGLMVFVSNRKHLLVTLISLEFLVLLIYMVLFVFLCLISYEVYFSMILLTMSVCEGALGLSILVSLIRTHGNDYFQSYNILQC